MRRSFLLLSVVLMLAGFGVARASAQASFSTVGGGGFWGPGLADNMHGWSASISPETTIVTTGNEVRVRQFILQSSFTIGHITTSVGSGSGGASTFNFGIYDASGNLLLDSGAFNGANSVAGTVQTNSITSVTLAPGTYFFAQTASIYTVSPLGVAEFATGLIAADAIANATTARYAIAANPASGGSLPSTLGTLTSETTNATGTGTPFFEP
jgi:hypothetical protein